jgi:general secretion pathway protein D
MSMTTQRARPLRPRIRRLAGTVIAALAGTSQALLPTAGWAQTPDMPRPQPQAQILSSPPAAEAAPRSGAPRFRGDRITLNFVNAEIDGVSRAMAAIVRKQILVDPRVRGQITLYSEQPLRPDEAYRNYLAALRGLGFTVVEVDGLLKVVPEADAKLQTGTVSVGGGTPRRGDQVLTQIFKLNHENANNLVPVLRPLISPNNTINATAGANSLVITDYADNLARIGKIIAAMDTPNAGDVEVIALQHAVASDIAPLIQRANDGGAAGVPGAGGTAAIQVLIDSRSNSLLIKAPTPARLASVRALVQQLDRPLQGNAAQGNIWVVPLKNADAVKLATVLRAAFSAGTGGGGGSMTGGGPSASPLVSPSAAPGGAGNVAAASPVGASPSPSTGGFVQADPATNSLIITAPEPLYRQMRSMIEQLDSRRAQIYIESMIVEVSGGNDADFGFQWQGLIGKNGDNTGLAIGTNSSIGGPSIISLAQTVAGAGAKLPGEGLNIGLIRNFGGAYNLAAIARILQSQSNTNIISTPNLVTLDNEEAKIIVGSNVPFITGQFTNTGTATTSPFQTIERKDVGITLRIRPQVGEGGSVRMTLFQESSSLSTTTAPGTRNAGPSPDKRSIESTVMVDDGQIIVLGGLIEDRYTDNKSKVPLLGDLPWVGGLFRSESRSKKRTNLMVFLRPIVMRDGNTADRLSIDRYEQIRAFQKDNQPRPNALIPINEAPVLPPSREPQAPASTEQVRRDGSIPAPLSPASVPKPPAAPLRPFGVQPR